MDDANIPVMNDLAESPNRARGLKRALLIAALCASGLALLAGLNFSATVVGNINGTCGTTTATARDFLTIVSLPALLLACALLFTELRNSPRKNKLRDAAALLVLDLVCLASPWLWAIRLRYLAW